MREETIKRLEGLSESDFIAAVRTVFPHGHEDFIPTTVAEMELHSIKNFDYASGGSPIGNFDRVSAILALYPGLNLADRRVVALVYALKQLDAVLWGLAKKIVHKVEGLNERLGDISIYAKLVICMNLEDARNKAEASRVEVGRTNLPSDEWKHPQWNPSLPPIATAMGHTVESAMKEARPYTSEGMAEAKKRSKCPDLNKTRDAECATGLTAGRLAAPRTPFHGCDRSDREVG